MTDFFDIALFDRDRPSRPAGPVCQDCHMELPATGKCEECS